MGIRQWLKHFLIYGAGVVMLNALPILLIPLYTHSVSPSDYGALELLNRSQDLLLLFLTLGMRSTLVTLYQMERDNAERQSALYSTALQFLMVFSFFILGAACLGSSVISRVLFSSAGYKSEVLIILCSAYFECLFQIATLYLQSEVKSAFYVFVFSTRAAFAVLMNYILVAGMKWGIRGIFWATLIQTSISAIAVLVYMFRRTGFAFDRGLLRDVMHFGLPLVPGALAGFVLSNGDRYFLNLYGSRTSVGIYGLSYRLSMIPMTLVMQPFTKIWSATMVDIARDKDGPAKLGKICTGLLAACCFTTLVLSSLAPCLVRLISPQQYWNAYRLIPIIGAAYVFYSWTVVTDASFYITKKTKYKLVCLLIAAAVILPLYWVLIRRYNVAGAAWATLVGYAALAVASLYFSKKVYWIRYEWPRIAALFALACSIYWMTTLVPPVSEAKPVIMRILLVLLYPAILCSPLFANAGERSALKRLLAGAIAGKNNAQSESATA